MDKQQTLCQEQELNLMNLEYSAQRRLPKLTWVTQKDPGAPAWSKVESD